MKKLFLSLVILLSLTIFGCGGDNGTGNGGGGDDDFVQANLLAYITDTAPSMENINDAIWDSAAVCTVRVGFDTLYGVNSRMTDDTMFMKVIQTSTDIYVRATWEDFNPDYKGSYIRKTGGAGTWEVVDLADAGAGDDAFFIMFDAGNGSEGADCASMCHAVANSMATTGGGDVDSWAWLSGTTNGAKMAEDQWLGNGDPLEADHLGAGDRLTFTNNWNGFLLQPIYMHTTDTSFTGNYLYTADTIPYMNSPSIGWDSIDGYRMPLYVIDSTVYKDPTAGGRWDVQAVSSYSEASDQWTIVLKRSLTTDDSGGGDLNDVDLSSVDSIEVSIAISDHHTVIEDDAGWREHSGSYPFYIVFNRAVP